MRARPLVEGAEHCGPESSAACRAAPGASLQRSRPAGARGPSGLGLGLGRARGLGAGASLSPGPEKGSEGSRERESGRLGLLSASRRPPGTFPTSSRGSSWRSRPVAGQWKETH